MKYLLKLDLENQPDRCNTTANHLKMVPDFPYTSFPHGYSSTLQQLPLIPLQFVICPVLQATEELLQSLFPASSLMPFEVQLRKVELLTCMFDFCRRLHNWCEFVRTILGTIPVPRFYFEKFLISLTHERLCCH